MEKAGARISAQKEVMPTLDLSTGTFKDAHNSGRLASAENSKNRMSKEVQQMLA